MLNIENIGLSLNIQSFEGVKSLSDLVFIGLVKYKNRILKSY